MKKEKSQKKNKKKEKKAKTAIVVNIAGGPGTGKSILTAKLFAKLKEKFISCEISSEYIKRKLREDARKVVQNQIYIFAKQQFQLFGMKDNVDVIITDSPFFLCSIYDSTECPLLKALILKEYSSYENLTYLIKRDDSVPYEQEGRYQDKEGAKLVDVKVEKFLQENKIPYQTLIGIGKGTRKQIVKDVIKKLQKK